MNYQKWLNNNAQRLDGKLVAITGSTGSLGTEICCHLSSLGANLLFIDRNEKKSTAHKESLLKEYPNIKIDIVIMDLEDIDSVYKAIEKIKKFDIDYLILNAAAYSIKCKITSLNYDNIFQINFIAPYILSEGLLPKLNERNGKIIIVGSISYNFVKMNANDYDYSDCPKQIKAYGNSKRWLMFSLSQLIQQYPNTSLAIAHPGITFTNIYNDYPKWLYHLVKYPMKLIFMSPKKASLSVVKGLCSDMNIGYWCGPKLLGIWGKPKILKYKYKSVEAEEIFNKAQIISLELK